MGANNRTLSLNNRWRSIWTRLNGDKKGQLDEDAARVRVHGWWKDLRKDFRVSGCRP